MTTTPKNIIPRKFAENSQTTQYTADKCKTLFDKFTATNISAGNVVFSVNLVITGGTAGSSNRVLSLRTITPNETYLCPEIVGQSVENGGFISTLCDTASALVISSTGREIT